MSSSELNVGEVAEPFRFNFEIAWEVANKGGYIEPLYLASKAKAGAPINHLAYQLELASGVFTVSPYTVQLVVSTLY